MPARIPLANNGQVPLRKTGDYTADTPDLSAGDTGLGKAIQAVGELAEKVTPDLVSAFKPKEKDSLNADDVNGLLEGERLIQASSDRITKQVEETTDADQAMSVFNQEHEGLQKQISQITPRMTTQGQTGLQRALAVFSHLKPQWIQNRVQERKNQVAEQAVVERVQQATAAGDRGSLASTLSVGVKAGVLSQAKADQLKQESDAAFYQQGVAKIQDSLKNTRDTQGALSYIQQERESGGLNDADYAKLERDIRYRGNLYRWEDLAADEPMSLTEAERRKDKDFLKLAPQDRDELIKTAHLNWVRKGREEVRAAREALDHLDLDQIREGKSDAALQLQDLGLPSLRHADPVMISALDHYLSAKQGKASLDRPALFQWARTLVENYNAKDDPEGQSLEWTQDFIGLSFGKREAHQLLSALEERVENPNMELGFAFEAVDKQIFGGNDLDRYWMHDTYSARNTGAPRLSIHFGQQMPQSFAARAAEVERIKNTLRQSLTDGRAEKAGGVVKLAQELLSEKKNEDPALAYQKVVLDSGGGEQIFRAPPGTVFHPVTGQAVSKYSFLHHEAWETRASELYGMEADDVPWQDNPTLQEIVGMAYERGFSHEKTATFIHGWRRQMQEKAASVLGEAETERYMKGTHRLNELTGTMLKEVRKDAVQDWALRTFGEGSLDYEAFWASYEANGGNPEAMGGFKKQAEELRALETSSLWQVPNTQSSWQPLRDKNGVEVATFQPVMRGKQVDVQVNYRNVDEETAITRVTVPLLTDAVMAEKMQTAEAKVAQLQAQVDRFDATPLDRHHRGESSTRMKVRNDLKKAREEVDFLRKPEARSILMTRNIMDALVKSPAGERLGKSGLTEDFLRGWSGFYINSRVAWNDLTGDATERDEWREHMQNLRQYLPGSTGEQAGLASELMEGAGGMAPQFLASAASGGAGFFSTAARQALMKGGGLLTTTTMTGMGVSAYGGSVTDQLSRADVLEKEGKIEEANEIRSNYRLRAGLYTAVELGSEFIVPEKLIPGGKGGFWRNLTNDTLKSGLEGMAADVGSQWLDGTYYGEEFDPMQTLKAGGMEAVLGLPMTVPGSIPGRESSPSIEGTEHTAEVPELSSGDPDFSQADGASSDSSSASSLPGASASTVESAAAHPAADVSADPLPGVSSPGAATSTQEADPKATPSVSANPETVAAEPKPQDHERLQFSHGRQSRPNDEVVNVHRTLAESEEAFQFGKNKPTTQGDSRNSYWREALDDVADAYSQKDHAINIISEHESFPGGYAFNVEAKNGSAFVVINEERKTVHINAAGLNSNAEKSGGGSQVYQMVQTFAHNNGFKFIPDGTVSPIAKKRRISQMISSALRHKSTDHLNGLMDLDDGSKTEVPGWRKGAHDYNLGLLLRAEHDYVMAEARQRAVDLSHLTHDPTTNNIIDGHTGTPVTQRTLQSLVDRLEPGASGVGASTLLRALVTGSALQGGRSGQRIRSVLPDEGRDARGNQNGQSDERLVSVARRLYYSRAPSRAGGVSTRRVGDALSGRPTTLSSAVAKATRFLNKKLPGLLHKNTHIFSSVQELLASDYARRNPFTDQQRAALTTAEGFFDKATGKTIIIAENIALRPHESVRSGMARVILHERIGHDGLNVLLGEGGIHRQRWDALRSQIPHAELDAIAKEEGYRELAGDADALALEWFARKAETDMSLLESQPLLKQMWETLKQAATDLMAKWGIDRLKGKDLDTQVREMMNRARGAAVKPVSQASPKATAARYAEPSSESGGIQPALQFSHAAQDPAENASMMRQKIEQAVYRSSEKIHGGINSAWKLTNGVTVVFKPEVGEVKKRQRAGVAPGTQWKREIAASLIADYLNSSIIPPTGLVTHKGVTGSAQLYKPGMIEGGEAQWLPKPLRISKQDCYPIRLPDALAEEWQLMDDLLLHADRHENNYLVHLNESGEVDDVALIDNGMALSANPGVVSKLYYGPREGELIGAPNLERLRRFVENQSEIENKLSIHLESSAIVGLFARAKVLLSRGRYGNFKLAEINAFLPAELKANKEIKTLSDVP
ncbi:hypothetical protein SAMN02745166_02260 [Prosthecobacter debontii]|uniref:Large polyvalent protein associated domain-containing protein n=1 Tax=Prosthecobacter debontii TaxID=48467 RepID=A0A1T4XZQ6_9BACT|nr:hypothetical protein [Prosthecobacter debontii]SKA95067.1 hypothetical protein SAMN02745166_02260 [Prosthecobacter debontii]